ncbi:uncharacterized protein LOC114720580 [Neltuma alba]|uniref:uncharacterized protein LOC114720580 n=1 Tax=Neltuma alba TaxID=207710 RepID=UPI0010A5596A|nr:uncharacterized protein LOC114720580 [Prosopis alba]
MEERKFVCKYCNKKYPCGKSLGGHIKIHMTTEHYSSPQSKEGKTNADDSVVEFDGGRKRKRDSGSEEAASGNPIYGLRENPKKTTRFVHSSSVAQQERFCNECGKGFLSLKALCGHMACHSEKDKGMTNKFENNSGFSMKQKLAIDSQSDNETSAPNHPRRSRRMRFKNPNTDKNDHRSFVSLANGSSSVSEVEQEQEEVARCLMLLSRDSSHKGRFLLPTESSDNNSVVVEAKSPSVDTIITFNNGKKSSVSNGFEIVKEKKKVEQYNSMQLKSAEIVDSDNSDSGYFRNGHKKLDSSMYGYPRNGDLKTSKVEARSSCEFDQNYDAELRQKMLINNRGRTRCTEPRKLTLEDLDYNTKDGAAREELINWRRRPRYGSLRQQNSVGVSCKRTPNGFHNEESLETESLNREKMTKDCQDSSGESDESSTDTDAYTAPRPHNSKVINGKKASKSRKKLKLKKSRDHECPICYKNFKSGQALGGHKRSHFVGGSEDNTLVIGQGLPVVPCLIDLNLPAPVDD